MKCSMVGTSTASSPSNTVPVRVSRVRIGDGPAAPRTSRSCSLSREGEEERIEAGEGGRSEGRWNVVGEKGGCAEKDVTHEN